LKGNLKQHTHTWDVIVHNYKIPVIHYVTTRTWTWMGIYEGFKLLFHSLGTQLQTCGYIPT